MTIGYENLSLGIALSLLKSVVDYDTKIMIKNTLENNNVETVDELDDNIVISLACQVDLEKNNFL